MRDSRGCCAVLALALLGCNGLAASGTENLDPPIPNEPAVPSEPARPTSPPVDVGAPVPAPIDRCTDGVQNGFETDVDCGGECGLTPCPGEFEVCSCAQGEVLRALSCGWNTASWFHSTPAGDTIVYSVNGHSYRWTRAGGTELLRAQSDAIRISDDAQTVLLSVLGSSDLLVWRANGPNDVLAFMTAFDMSTDGRVVLAWEYSSAPHSVIWTRERGAVAIAETQASSAYRAEVMARDGSAVVGVRENLDPANFFVEPMLWTESAGTRLLGPLPPGALHGRADAVTRGGAVVGGSLSDAEQRPVGAFRWTEREGLRVVIPGPAGGWFPTLMSDDGETLVSLREEGDTTTGWARALAVRWDSALGVVALDPGEEQSSFATAMTADGDTIVGHSARHGGLFGGEPGDGVSPFLWHPDVGYVDIPEALARAGVDLQGWQLGYPGAISADGRVIVGNATCGGVASVYRLELPR